MFLEGSGARNILVESETFGVNVIDTVMNGTKYSKSVKGLMILCESLQRYKIMTFLNKNKNYKRYESMINLINNSNSLILTDAQRMNDVHDLDVGSLIDEFTHWTENCKAKSKLFCYWNIFIDMALLLANLILADRMGDFKLHLYCVEKSLELFSICGKINYQRYVPLYLTDMKQLHKETSEKFNLGAFTFKHSSLSNNKSVAIDMALEQSINRSQKSTSGIIGCTRRIDYVTQWELTCHERMDIEK